MSDRAVPPTDAGEKPAPRRVNPCLSEGGDLIVEQVRLGPLWNFAYLVGSRGAGEAIAVDPGDEVEVLLARAEALGLRLTAAVVTHCHLDHTRGLEHLVARTGAIPLVHHEDEQGLRAHYRGPLRAVDHDARLAIGPHEAALWHAPGHTAGSQWLVVDGAVFSGDTLMVGCIGRTGAEPDAAERMWQTFSERFPLLPDETRIYPGHDYGPARVSTAGVERRRIAALRARTPAEFLAALPP